MGIADAFILLKAASAIIEAVKNSVNADDVTPEMLDARDAVRAEIVALAQSMGGNDN